MRRPIVILFVASTFVAGLLGGYVQAASRSQPLLRLAQVAARQESSAGTTQAAPPGGAAAAVSRAAAPSRAGAAAPPHPAGTQQPPAQAGPAGTTPPPAPAGETRIHPCGPAGNGFALCHAVLVQPAGKDHNGGSAPGGLNPSDLQSAYALPSSTAGTGRTVAIVDAFDDPNAE